MAPRALSLVAITISLSACVFVPKKVEVASDDGQCVLKLPKWTMESQAMLENGSTCGSDADAATCLLVMGVIMPAGSLVVSGSFVMTGNTVRWLEHQGTCDDGVLKKGWSMIDMDNLYKASTDSSPDQSVEMP